MVARTIAIAVSACTLAAAITPSASAQIRASERGMVSQTVDGTVITIDYSRPQARGRDSLFGRIVHPGDIWTPGANWATTFEVNRPVKLGGKDVPAGKYSVWMTPGAAEWTVYLHRTAQLFHTQKPRGQEMFLAVVVKPESGDPVEVLTFDFPRVARDGATLRLRWGTAVVPLEILVQASKASRTLNEAELVQYLGSYVISMEGEGGAPATEMKGELVNAKGALRLVSDAPWGAFTMEFIPTETPHKFFPALVDKGAIVDVEEVPVFFELEGGQVVGFRIMGIGDDVWIRAKRPR